MRMRRGCFRLPVWGLCLGCAAASAATLKDALDVAPLDTLALVCVPSVSGLQDEFLRTIRRLALDAMLPPAVASPLSTMRAAMKLGDAFDADGAMMVGLLNAPILPELSQRGFFLLPAKDPKALVEGMGGQPGGEEGVWTLDFLGSPSHATIRGKHLVVAQSPATAKAAAADPGHALGDVISREDLESLQRQDVFVWVKLEEGLKLVKPQIDLFMSMSMLAQAATGPAGMKQAEATKKQVEMLLMGLSTFIVGASLEDSGVGLRFAVRARPGSELDQTTRRPQTAEPLLRGISAERFLVAAGSRAAPDMVKLEIETSLKPFLAVGEAVPGVDKAKYAEFAKRVEEWVGMSTGVRFAIVGAPEEGSPEDGLLGVVTYVETTDAPKWVELFGQNIESLRSLFSADGVETDPQLKLFLSALQWGAEPENIGESKAARLTVDLSKSGKVQVEEVQAVKAVLGRDGLCARVGVVDEKTVGMTIGGGRKFVEAMFASGPARSAALEENPGVKRTASHLPKEREAATYVAVDRIVKIVPRIMEAIGEKQAFPVKMPLFDAPVGFTSSGGEHVTRLDVFVPEELLVAVKDAALSASAGNKNGADGRPGKDAPKGSPQGGGADKKREASDAAK